MARHHNPPNSRANRERGAALVEFALVATVLFTILFGLIEVGLMVRARSGIDNATADAARRGAIAADDDLADFYILQQLLARGAHEAASINFVVVYRGVDGTSEPTAGCKAGSPEVGECNVYSREEMDFGAGSFGCTSPNLDQAWCPRDRQTAANTFEYVGVWVDATHVGFVPIPGRGSENTGHFGTSIIANTSLPIEAGGLS